MINSVTACVPSSHGTTEPTEAVMLVHHKHLIWFSFISSVLKWSRVQLCEKMHPSCGNERSVLPDGYTITDAWSLLTKKLLRNQDVLCYQQELNFKKHMIYKLCKHVNSCTLSFSLSKSYYKHTSFSWSFMI